MYSCKNVLYTHYHFGALQNIVTKSHYVTSNRMQRILFFSHLVFVFIFPSTNSTSDDKITNCYTRISRVHDTTSCEKKAKRCTIDAPDRRDQDKGFYSIYCVSECFSFSWQFVGVVIDRIDAKQASNGQGRKQNC